MILITGGAGYIGSHLAHYLVDKKVANKDEIIIIDNLEKGKIENIRGFKFFKIDLKNKKLLEELFKEYNIETIYHFAAYVQVNESVLNPDKYFINNELGTLNLVELASKYNSKLIFSSTAAVYGNPRYVPIDENHPLNPENPYGASKLNAENIIIQYNKWKNLKAVILRYFNVIGSYYSLPTNEQGLPFALIDALKNGKKIKIFGKNYNTKDGTPVRDYINVLDLIEGHIKASEFLNKKEFGIFNLGTKKGYTVLEVIKTFNEILEEYNKKIDYVFENRREGDVGIIVADNSKAKKELNWEPRRTLKESLRSLINNVFDFSK